MGYSLADKLGCGTVEVITRIKDHLGVFEQIERRKKKGSCG
jgi:hypothetical protein